MAFTFPSSPNTNDIFTVGSRTYTWAGTKWVLTGGVITSAQIQANAVTTTKILDANVTAAKLASGAITAAVLASGATNTFVLMADSTTATGVKWAVIPPSGGLSTSTEGAIMVMDIGG